MPPRSIASEPADQIRRNTHGPHVSVCLSFDFDAICVWLGSLNATSPSAISRGEFGAVATERLLDMLARWEIKSTWFIPVKGWR
jgi:hypothetical protein